MQVANALNNQIRILFNPNVETFKLFDFLIVKSNEDRYLAQIIEIYDDKFDASQNVAKLKLFYKISKENEVIPYDSFTPNKECEIVKIKQEEVEQFINNGKKTFSFGVNIKNSTPLNLPFDFFNNNPIILADKTDSANNLCISLAKNLSKQKNTVVIDSTGILEFRDIPKIKVSEDFKMPLNYTTIDYVFEKCLEDASLEFQSIALDILNEIKKFAKNQESGFIPFNAFIRVLLKQYEATPYPELKILIAKLKKLQMDNVFARNKKDVENLTKTINENKITIIDISSAGISWQKAYLDYIIDAIKENIYLLTRLNDENCDVDLINKTYNKKKNISFIPNISYNYKKLPTVIQNCKNYILLPSLYQRNDFLDANFALCNLISDGCIIFGDDTDNFLYMIKNYGFEVQEEKKVYRKIALSLLDEEERNEEDNIDNQKDYFETFQKEIEQANIEKNTQEAPQEVSDSKKLIEKLGAVEENSEKIEIKENEISDKEEVLKPLEDKKEDEKGIQEQPEEIKDEFQNISNYKEDKEFDILEEKNEEIQIKPETKNEDFSETLNNELDKEDEIFKEEVQTKQTIQDEPIEEEIIDLTTPSTPKEENLPQAESIQDDGMETIDLLSDSNIQNQQDEPEASSTDSIELEDIETDLSEDDLDFFQIAKESSEIIEDDEPVQDVVVDEVQYKSKNNEVDNIKKEKIESEQFDIIDEDDDNDIDLNAVAQQSIDESFNQIIEETNTPKEDYTINVTDGADINLENMKETKENLPIFKEEQKISKNKEFKVGDTISHSKYGRGSVVKTMRYESRQLLQIEFENAGKKLLDPKIANIKLLEQQV